MKDIFKKLTIAQSILLIYISIIFIGGILLSLPYSSNSGNSTAFIDAIFTATSATAVTGQITLNTASHWNFFGKTVILILIEIGGLGFMTIWIFLYYVLIGQSPDLKQRMIVTEALSLDAGENIKQKIWYILRFALSVQLIGAILLSFVFIPDYGQKRGIYYSIFHSISAFCNAGFDLIGDSLISYQDNSYLLLVIAGLIIAGGLGFIVWEDLLKYYKRRTLNNYTKIVLITTLSLWILGTLYFGLVESQNGTFSHLTPVQQFVNYFFLSVTPRTAGFVNVDYATLSHGSLFLTYVLMFIGATSASTGGGIKVSTFAVLLIVIYRYINKKRSVIFHREISEETTKQSFFIFTLGIIFAVLSILVLLVTETIPDGHGLEFLFMEVFSTLGTVGLTMGMTPLLSPIGKIILIILMLIGRVGVLTFLWSLAGKKRESRINYPGMKILIG